MLPLRLSLEGFLSYRDRTEFDFSGSRLWMLCGLNGAGKSTVFDALRFVLYGTHRAGKQNAELLVHHESARLRVEADLQLGEEVFRLVRTIGREGARSTWQIRRREGDNWSDVPEAAMKGDYDRWVAQNIGLSDEAFCAAVYLSQGQADKILDPDPEARYDLLSQLVDLRVYEGWHERAEERRLNARAAHQEARRRWQSAPQPDADELQQKQARLAALEQERDELGARERELDSLQSESARWETWKGELEALSREADEQHVLLRAEEAIERGFTRFTHLEGAVKPLEDLLAVCARHDELEGRLARLRPQLEQAEQAFQGAKQSLEIAANEEKEAQNAERKASDIFAALELESARLAPGEDELARLQTLRGELARLRDQLAQTTVEPDLETLELARDEARETARLLPVWRRFLASRATKHEMQTRLEHDEAASDELKARAEEEQQANEAAQRAWDETEQEVERVREEETRAKLRLEAAKKARSDFQRVEGEERCHFCGQELSPQHALAEHERLEREESGAALELKGVQEQLKVALRARKEVELALKAAQNKAPQTAREAGQQHLEAALHLQKRDDSILLARAAWDELGGAQQEVWNSNDFEVALDSPRPDEDELATWQQTAASLPELERALTRAEKRRRERDEWEREQKRVERDLAPLSAKWPDEAEQTWRARWNNLGDDIKTAQSELNAARHNARQAQKNAKARATDLQLAREKRDELAARPGSLEGERNALARQIEALWPDVRATLDEEIVEPSTLLLHAQQMSWQVELAALQSADIWRRHDELQRARAALKKMESAAAFLVRSLEELPARARRRRSELERELKTTRERLVEVRAQAKQVEEEVVRGQRELKEGARLELQMQSCEREHDLASELAQLLGPRQLQRHLLREAERGIVREANAVLEAISGGTLRLELRAEGDDATGAKVPKVLDVVCHHLSGSAQSRPILPAFLSGSQRFRVAVALALGIGRCAARGQGSTHGGRVETILIDEGFGSLDKAGRDEMRDELRLLGRELSRIILVSHQEDFAQGFPARFNIEMEEGVSRARMIVE